MEVKAKNSSIVGKEKKTPSSNSHIINSTKKITKPSSQKTSSSTNNANPTSLSKPIIRSHLETPSSFKNPKSDISPNGDNINRRRSFDRPQPSSSNLSKQNQPSPTSRLQKALVSPGPDERKLSVRSSIVPVRNPIPAKTISNKIGSKNPNYGKIKQVYVVKSTKKSSPSSVSTSTNIKKENNDHASPKVSNIENEEVKEVINQDVEVIKVVNDESKDDHISKISPKVLNGGSDCKRDYIESQNEHDQGIEESDKPHNQDDDEKVISTVKEETIIKDGHENEENNNHEDDNNNNNNMSDKEEHYEAEEVMANEKEDERDVLINDHVRTSENNNEEEEKESVEGGTSEIIVEKIKVETTPQNQHGKKESQLSNDVIEETTNKLLEQERKNKVRAMAGAFQTVIDYQTISK